MSGAITAETYRTYATPELLRRYRSAERRTRRTFSMEDCMADMAAMKTINAVLIERGAAVAHSPSNAQQLKAGE